MNKILFIDGRRDGYAPEQCYNSMTVSQLINVLEDVLSDNGDIPVYLKNDNGYTYGSIDYSSFETANYTDKKNEEYDEDEYEEYDNEEDDGWIK